MKEYEARVLEALGTAEEPLSMTALAHVLGYKGITRRLTATMDELVAAGKVIAVPSPSLARLRFALPDQRGKPRRNLPMG